MSNEPNQDITDNTQLLPQKYDGLKHRLWNILWWIIITVMLFGVDTVFLFQNIPLLITAIFFVSGFILINKLFDWRFGRPKPRTWRLVKINFYTMVTYIVYIVVILYVT
jgi:hypothetical protein